MLVGLEGMDAKARQNYLTRLRERYAGWETNYTPTDATPRQQRELFEEAPRLDLGLMVRIIEREKPEFVGRKEVALARGEE